MVAARCLCRARHGILLLKYCMCHFKMQAGYRWRRSACRDALRLRECHAPYRVNHQARRNLPLTYIWGVPAACWTATAARWLPTAQTGWWGTPNQASLSPLVNPVVNSDASCQASRLWNSVAELGTAVSSQFHVFSPQFYQGFCA